MALTNRTGLVGPAFCSGVWGQLGGRGSLGRLCGWTLRERGQGQGLGHHPHGRVGSGGCGDWGRAAGGGAGGGVCTGGEGLTEERREAGAQGRKLCPVLCPASRRGLKTGPGLELVPRVTVALPEDLPAPQDSALGLRSTAQGLAQCLSCSKEDICLFLRESAPSSGAAALRVNPEVTACFSF